MAASRLPAALSDAWVSVPVVLVCKMVYDTCATGAQGFIETDVKVKPVRGDAHGPASRDGCMIRIMIIVVVVISIRIIIRAKTVGIQKTGKLLRTCWN